MRVIERALVLGCEIGVLVFGLVVSLVLGITVAFGIDPNRYGGNAGPIAGFMLGLVLTGAAFAAIRRMTRPWVIKWDTGDWARAKAEREFHPARVRWRRVALRIGVWVPSAIAAGVLFFLPAATHFVHPSSHYLRHYRVPIPWNTTVLTWSSPPLEYGYVLAYSGAGSKGRFGVTPSYIGEELSEMAFQSFDPHGDMIELIGKRGPGRAKPAQESRRDFRVGGVALTCWGYAEPYHFEAWDRPARPGALRWYIGCGTPVDVRERNLYAWFAGRESDVPMFYGIVAGARAVD